MSQTPAPKLPSSFTMKVNGQDHEVFMSFALLNKLAYYIGQPEQVFTVLLDPVVREIVMKELLAERSKTGRIKQEVELEDLDFDLEEVESLLDWAAEHLLVFTLAVAEKATAHQLRYQNRLLNLTSTVSGLANSTLKTSAA
ncbi:MAG TPA: hypothetical protein VEC99_05720 [Clostridia bacterium]|nr:hypothetical protein [Clostridia bacterium]